MFRCTQKRVSNGVRLYKNRGFENVKNWSPKTVWTHDRALAHGSVKFSILRFLKLLSQWKTKPFNLRLRKLRFRAEEHGNWLLSLAIWRLFLERLPPLFPADYKQNVSCDCSRYNFTGSLYNLNVDKLNPGNSNFSRTRFPFSILLLQFNHRQLILFDQDSHSCVVPCRFELSCDDKCTDGRPRKRNLKPR